MMNLELKLWLFLGLGCFLLFILQLLKAQSLNLRYALTWLLSSLAMFFAVLFPELPALVASRIGIVEPVNAVFLLQGLLMMLILLSLTAIVSRLSEKNKLLVQQIALLEHRLRSLERQTREDA